MIGDRRQGTGRGMFLRDVVIILVGLFTEATEVMERQALRWSLGLIEDSFKVKTEGV